MTVESFKDDVQHVAPYAFQGGIQSVRSGVKKNQSIYHNYSYHPQFLLLQFYRPVYDSNWNLANLATVLYPEIQISSAITMWKSRRNLMSSKTSFKHCQKLIKSC